MDQARLSRSALLFAFTVAISVAYEPAKTEALMAETGSRLLESLDRMQRVGTLLPFDSPERTNWHYFPEPGFHDEYG